MTTAPRKPKRVLTAEQKYDLWVRMLTGQISQADAAAEAEVDWSVITRLRAVAQDGAIAALQASKPGRPRRRRCGAVCEAPPTDWVSDLQVALNDRGAGLVVDRIYGPNTRAAVTRFQEANGPRANGLIDPETADAHGLEGPNDVRIIRLEAGYSGTC